MPEGVLIGSRGAHLSISPDFFTLADPAAKCPILK
jgi:hypothetical protein